MTDEAKIRAARFKKDDPPKPENAPRPTGRPQTMQEAIDPADFYPPASPEPTVDEERPPSAEDLAKLRDLILGMQTRLATPEVRERIERNAEPIDFADVLTTGEVRQTVEIRPGLKVMFRSLSAEEDVYVKQLVEAEGSTSAAEAKRTLYILAMGIVKLNDEILPPHRDKDGEIDDDLLAKKFKRIYSLPAPVVTALSINYQWFVERIENWFINPESVEQAKNG